MLVRTGSSVADVFTAAWLVLGRVDSSQLVQLCGSCAELPCMDRSQSLTMVYHFQMIAENCEPIQRDWQLAAYYLPVLQGSFPHATKTQAIEVKKLGWKLSWIMFLLDGMQSWDTDVCMQNRIFSVYLGMRVHGKQ